jgi:pimeloyl-ACP methyl ester carboxylesterase
LQLTLDHPDRVGRLIAVSVSYASDGFHSEISDPAQHMGVLRRTDLMVPLVAGFLR